MWQLMRRGWHSTLRWSTRNHNQAQRFFGALKSQEGHWIALPFCCPTLGWNSAKIVKPPSQLDTSVRIVFLDKKKKRALICMLCPSVICPGSLEEVPSVENHSQTKMIWECTQRKITTIAWNTSALSRSAIGVGCVHNFIDDDNIMKGRALVLYRFSSILLDFLFKKLS